MKRKYSWQALASVWLLGILSAQAQWFTTIHNFTNDPDGGNPTQLTWANGLFFGTTQSGGTNNYNGTIFTFNPNGSVLNIIYEFAGGAASGATPNDALVVGNKIFGTTKFGGGNSSGVIYAINTDGTGYTNLYSFNSARDGTYALGLAVSANTLYGTTSSGSPSGGGTIFKINTDGSGFTLLHTNAAGSFPAGTLVVSGSKLFGVSQYGGANNKGVVFSMNTDGSGYFPLHNFAGSPDGAGPVGGLLLSGSVLYGTTASGGVNTNGTVFAITTTGNGYTNLYSFSAGTLNSDGTTPWAALSLFGSALYGTTFAGGSGGSGTVFQINTNGSGFTVIYTFPTNTIASSDQVQSGVIRVGNALWGTTSQGGSDGCDGSFYSLTLSPVITAQPQSITVANGFPASFSVGAEDLGGIRYQWYYNTNTLLGGQTGSTLNIANAGNGNAGYYTVSVSDNFGSVTSSPAQLTISSLPTAPTITQQPQNFTVTNGFTASFTNVATGTAPLFYQWYFNTNTLLTGATSAILVIAPATTNPAGYYSVIVTNIAGRATSAPARLTVIVPPPTATPPTITQQPQNFTVTNGFTASFTNVATGTAPLFYQWYFNTNTLLNGATNAILVLAPATTNSAGYYSVIVTNIAGRATSAPARLTVIVPPPTATPPTITQQPQNFTVTNGFTASFTNVATGTAPLFYQWYFNANTPVAGGTNAILVITPATTNQAGYYSVIVTNIAGQRHQCAGTIDGDCSVIAADDHAAAAKFHRHQRLRRELHQRRHRFSAAGVSMVFQYQHAGGRRHEQHSGDRVRDNKPGGFLHGQSHQQRRQRDQFARQADRDLHQTNYHCAAGARSSHQHRHRHFLSPRRRRKSAALPVVFKTRGRIPLAPSSRARRTAPFLSPRRQLPMGAIIPWSSPTRWAKPPAVRRC